MVVLLVSNLFQLVESTKLVRDPHFFNLESDSGIVFLISYLVSFISLSRWNSIYSVKYYFLMASTLSVHILVKF